MGLENTHPTRELSREKAYVRRIEKRFVALRSGALYISPRDFALLIDWHSRGVPVELVIEALEGLFTRAHARSGSRKIQSISYGRHAVEEAWEARRKTLIGTDPGAGGSPRGALSTDEVVRHLEQAAAALESAARLPSAGEQSPATKSAAVSRAERDATGQARLERVASRLCELAVRVRVGPAGGFSVLEDELVGLEKETIEGATLLLTPAELIAIEQRARERLEPFASRMSERMREATLSRAVDAAIRERSHLPRLSLLAISR